SNGLSELRFASAPGTIGTDYIFPLYLYEGSGQSSIFGQDKRTANFNEYFVNEFSKSINLVYKHEGEGDLSGSFGPESLLYYIYAVLYSSSYRSRFREQLKRDFPKVPIAKNREHFIAFANCGKKLVDMHLLGGNPFDRSKTIFDNPDSWGIKIGGRKPYNAEDWQIKDAHYEKSSKRIYVNDGQYFEGIEEEVWSLVLGGYQVCEKWLKDKKKFVHVLKTDDLKYYMKILVAVRETIKTQKEIDAVKFIKG
ncbi:hypothetical protein M1512_00255, partial [Patescibacteria group bacterium]|nr:hypothetical protein [Patescibacteria group bacterium]